MTSTELEEYLLAQIPLTRAMGLAVESTEPGIRLRFPLGPNLNHHATGFGGSLATAGILAGWCLVAVRLRREGIQAELVIAESNQRFVRPVSTDFFASADPIPDDVWAEFVAQLERRGKARLDVMSKVGDGAVLLSGRYAAFCR